MTIYGVIKQQLIISEDQYKCFMQIITINKTLSRYVFNKVNEPSKHQNNKILQFHFQK